MNSPDSGKSMDEWKLICVSLKLTMKSRSDGKESRLDASQAACTSFCQERVRGMDSTCDAGSFYESLICSPASKYHFLKEHQGEREMERNEKK